MRIFEATADHAEIVAGLLYDFNIEFDASTPSGFALITYRTCAPRGSAPHCYRK